MFTAKVLRIRHDGTEQQDLYEVRSVQHVNTEPPGAVVLRTSNEDMFIPLRSDANRPDRDQDLDEQFVGNGPAVEVIIENASGKTTEIYRA